jgi:hypothetical protein
MKKGIHFSIPNTYPLLATSSLWIISLKSLLGSHPLHWGKHTKNTRRNERKINERMSTPSYKGHFEGNISSNTYEGHF